MIAPIGTSPSYAVDPFSLLGRFRPPVSNPSASGPMPADSVQLSDLARSLIGQSTGAAGMVATQRLDLHAEIQELGLRVDAAGRYDARARSLSLDLRVTSRTGTLDLGDRTIQFEELRVELRLSQVEIQQSAAGVRDADPRRKLADGLKDLIALLHDNSQAGQTPAQLLLGPLDGGRGLFAGGFGQIQEFLKAIVEALQSLDGSTVPASN